MSDWLKTQHDLLLAQTEAMYGERDRRWVLGPTACFGDRPWCPAADIPGFAPTVTVVLSESAKFDADEALFQLGHEVVHLLSPHKSRSARMLEEGLATWNSLFMPVYSEPRVRMKFISNISSRISSNYTVALAAYCHLVAGRLDLVGSLRLIQPDLKQWDEVFLSSHVPNISAELAKLLAEERDMN